MSVHRLVLTFALLVPTAGARAQAVGRSSAPSVQPDTSSAAANASETDHRLATALALAATYSALGAWAWLAWYDEQPRLERWRLGGDGSFGRDTYAGGADKVGHAWTGLVLTRLGTGLLRAGGWAPVAASLLSAGAASLALLWVEINDGYYTEFSASDLTSNTLGALLGIAMERWPALDAAVDVRLQWFPSAAYRRRPTPNVAEDYSGQTYLLAFKPGALRVVRDAATPLAWLRFVNPVLAFETRHYKPEPPAGATPRQHLFVGVTLDMQAVVDAVLEGHPSRVARFGREVGHATFEYLNLPYSTLSVVGASRSSTRIGSGP